MAILMMPGKQTRAINPRGLDEILTRESGPIDWLPESSEFYLVKLGAAEFVGKQEKKREPQKPSVPAAKPEKPAPNKKPAKAKKNAAPAPKTEKGLEEMDAGELIAFAIAHGIGSEVYEDVVDNLNELRAAIQEAVDEE